MNQPKNDSAIAPRTIKYYWEDLPVGTTLDLGSVTPTRAEIVAFAQQFDPQPFHLDDAAAAQSMFGKLCASGWHTCSLAMRLTVDEFLGQAAGLGSPGLDNLRWLKPVFPGDTLSLRLHIIEARPMGSRPDVGLARAKWEMLNQHAEVVLTMEGSIMFRRRAPGAAA
ncbi:MAG: MaoC family dehydratase [Burkholderiaceae bacterium]